MYSPTGKRLLGATKDAIFEWQVADGKLTRAVKISEASLLDMHTVEDERDTATLLYVTGTSDPHGGMRIHDANKGEQANSLKWPSVGTVAVSPDGKLLLLAASSHSSHPVMIDRDTGNALNAPPYFAAQSASASRRSELFCMPTGESILEIWNVVSGKKLHCVELSGPCSLAAISSNGEMLATIEKDNIVVRQLPTSSVIARIPAPAGAVQIQFSRRDSYLAVSGRLDERYVTELIEVATWTLYRTVYPETYRAAKFDISPDERFIVTFCDTANDSHVPQHNPGIARVWHIHSSRVISIIDSGRGYISMAAFGCLGQRLILASTDLAAGPPKPVLSVWDLITKEKAWRRTLKAEEFPYYRRPVDTDSLIFVGSTPTVKEPRVSSRYIVDIWTGLQRGCDGPPWHALFPNHGTGLCYDAHRPGLLRKLDLDLLQVAPERIAPDDIEQLWEDLGDDAAKATPALAKLASSKMLPTELQFNRMLTKNFDQDKIAESFNDLSSDKAAVRDEAARRLTQYGEHAAVWIEHHLQSSGKPLPAEATLRLKSLLELGVASCPDNADARRLCRLAYLLSQSDEPLARTYLMKAYEQYKGTAVGYHFLTALQRFDERKTTLSAAPE